ncbi:hypothetical protein BVC80_8679g3 [Macleaya cordata]|uniref:Uncharacterized protein n=1 Tax=Macleaya cordata TaxID=56857 RepID=A0A200QAC9_MACCD|nr:hypothetical protein BVC80_8679g3 [Macleaya cordata]
MTSVGELSPPLLLNVYGQTLGGSNDLWSGAHSCNLFERGKNGESMVGSSFTIYNEGPLTCIHLMLTQSSFSGIKSLIARKRTVVRHEEARISVEEGIDFHLKLLLPAPEDLNEHSPVLYIVDSLFCIPSSYFGNHEARLLHQRHDLNSIWLVLEKSHYEWMHCSMNCTSSGFYGQGQQPEEQQQQQTIAQNPNNEQSSIQATSMQLASGNGIASVNNSLNANAATTTSASTIVGLLHQNSMNSRQENMNNSNSPYVGGNAVQIPSASSSSSLSQPHQPNPSSPFPSTSLPAPNNVPQQTSHSTLPTAAAAAGTDAAQITSVNSPAAANISMQQPTAQSTEAEPNDSQSSVQQIIQEMMMTSQLNGGGSMVGVGSSLGSEMKNINGMSGNSAAINGGNCLVANGNGITTNNSSGISGGGVGGGFGNMMGGGGVGISPTASGIRSVAAAAAAMGHNNSVTLNGRVGMASMMNQDYRNSMSHHQHQELGNRLLSGLGAVNNNNNFNNLQFDWKPSP